MYKNMETKASRLLEYDGIWYLDNEIARMKLHSDARMFLVLL